MSSSKLWNKKKLLYIHLLYTPKDTFIIVTALQTDGRLPLAHECDTSDKHLPLLSLSRNRPMTTCKAVSSENQCSANVSMHAGKLLCFHLVSISMLIVELTPTKGKRGEWSEVRRIVFHWRGLEHMHSQLSKQWNQIHDQLLNDYCWLEVLMKGM